MTLFRSLAWRMMARDARAARGRFLFVILAVAAGVGALTGVRGFSEAFRETLLREARTLMAADLAVRTFRPATPQQEQVLDGLVRQGVERTTVIETVSMLSPGGGNPIMVSLKAVDPARYPFYGQIQLDPDVPLRQALAADTVAVSDDLLLRLGLRAGETVRLGAADFRIAGVVRVEPDRMTGSLNVGPRLLLTLDGLDRTGLMQFGSRASYRFLLRLTPGGLAVAPAREALEEAFDRTARVTDFRETNPTITRGLNRATRFLSLVSLIALIVGGLGVASAVHSHLQQRLETIGILKCLGARSGQVLRIYLFQALGLGLAGSVLGITIGFLVQAMFPRLIRAYFVLPVDLHLTARAAFEGLGVGVLTTLLFTLPPLLQIRGIRPADIFRREMQESRLPWRERLVAGRASLAAGGLILIGLGSIAAWLSTSPQMGIIFLGGIVISLAGLSTAAWLLLRGLRVLPAMLPWRLPMALRHGLANLYRPGSHSGAVLVALGVGVTFTLTIYLVQGSVLTEMVRSAPPDMPNVFFINVTDHERGGIVEILRSQPGVEEAPEPVPSISGRLVSVNGTPADQLPLEGWAQRFRGPRFVTWSANLPRHTEVVQGAFWTSRPAPPEISVEEDAARVLGVVPGVQLVWQVAGRDITARVVAIHRPEFTRFGSNMEFIFSPGVLDGLPMMHFASARVQARYVPALQKAVFDRFPTVTVVNAADVLQIVQQVIDHISLVVRFISGFAILGGVIVLAASVAGTRFRRLREVTILKTLGATRPRVARIFSVEFLVLGAVAGFMGSLLANAFSQVVLRRLMEADLRVDWSTNLATVIATALLANFAGWVVSFRLLGQKPLEILRHE